MKILFRAAVLSCPFVVVACDGNEPIAPTQPPPPVAVATPSPRPTPVPTPTPAVATYDHGVDFRVIGEDSVTRVRAPRFAVGARGPVEGGVSCRGRWFELSRIHLFSGGGQRVDTVRCGPASSTCNDVAFSWTLDPGDYEIEIERDFAYRWSNDYHCRVTLTHPKG